MKIKNLPSKKRPQMDIITRKKVSHILKFSGFKLNATSYLILIFSRHKVKTQYEYIAIGEIFDEKDFDDWCRIQDGSAMDEFNEFNLIEME
jgi:hypothetical protein